MASAVRVYNGAYANVTGSEAVQRQIAALPALIAQAAQDALDKGADQLVDTIRSAAPVAPEFETHHGQLRDSVHKEQTDRQLSASVVVDAKDARGQYYAAHVEYGHKTKSGKHVPATRFFWASYRVSKKKIKSSFTRAVNKAVKATALGQASS